MTGIFSSMFQSEINTVLDELRPIEDRFKAMGEMAKEIATVINTFGQSGKFSKQQAAALVAKVQTWATLLSQRVVSFVETRDEGVAKDGLRASFAELQAIAKEVTNTAQVPDVTWKYAPIIAPEPPTPIMSSLLKWALILGGSAIAFKYLWNRAAPEYPRAQLPNYAGGRRHRGDD